MKFDVAIRPNRALAVVICRNDTPDIMSTLYHFKNPLFTWLIEPLLEEAQATHLIVTSAKEHKLNFAIFEGYSIWTIPMIDAVQSPSASSSS